jgi:23S rRNA pseudouridine2605 synthase
MKTSFGYIGADTFTRQREGQGKPRGVNRGGRKSGRG